MCSRFRSRGFAFEGFVFKAHAPSPDRNRIRSSLITLVTPASSNGDSETRYRVAVSLYGLPQNLQTAYLRKILWPQSIAPFKNWIQIPASESGYALSQQIGSQAMRAWPAASQGAAPPWTPQRKTSVQSAVVKFKLTPAQKARLINAAESADTSMSALLRRSAMIVAAGRSLDRDTRLDIAAMRAAANALKAAIDDIGAEPTEVADRLRQAACELHRIAVRQLDIRR
jgi:hypothetical protein